MRPSFSATGARPRRAARLKPTKSFAFLDQMRKTFSSLRREMPAGCILGAAMYIEDTSSFSSYDLISRQLECLRRRGISRQGQGHVDRWRERGLPAGQAAASFARALCVAVIDAPKRSLARSPRSRDSPRRPFTAPRYFLARHARLAARTAEEASLPSSSPSTYGDFHHTRSLSQITRHFLQIPALATMTRRRRRCFTKSQRLRSMLVLASCARGLNSRCSFSRHFTRAHHLGMRFRGAFISSRRQPKSAQRLLLIFKSASRGDERTLLERKVSHRIMHTLRAYTALPPSPLSGSRYCAGHTAIFRVTGRHFDFAQQREKLQSQLFIPRKAGH